MLNFFARLRLGSLVGTGFPWYSARSMNMWANVNQAGDPAEARNRCSTASCQ